MKNNHQRITANKKINHLVTALKRVNLKVTDLRLILLDTLIKEKNSVSQADLIQKLSFKKNFDRVSIYRNLRQLKKTGLIHEVEFNKYISCGHECNKHAHILLYCNNCEQHSEIKDHKKINSFIKSIKELQFFDFHQHLFIKGVCNQCLKATLKLR